jgi:hypothetical protein
MPLLAAIRSRSIALVRADASDDARCIVKSSRHRKTPSSAGRIGLRKRQVASPDGTPTFQSNHSSNANISNTLGVRLAS